MIKKTAPCPYKRLNAFLGRLFTGKGRFCVSGGKKACPPEDTSADGTPSRIRLPHQSAFDFTWQAAKMLLILLAATACAHIAAMYYTSRESVVMIYTLGVIVITLSTKGYTLGISAAVISTMMVKYLFTEPKLTSFLPHFSDLIPFGTFMTAALVAGAIMNRLRREKEAALRNEATARLLYEVSVGFAHVTGRKNIALKGIAYIREHTGLECAVMLEGEEVYRGPNDTMPLPDTAGQTILPIQGVWAPLGQLHVFAEGRNLSLKQELVVKSVAARMGAVLEREMIYNERENIRIAMESEKLRGTMLRAIAHDLRGSLTALSGASALLADNYETLKDHERKKLAVDISEEMVWLTNLVENILNMTRIQESRLVFNREEEVVDDVVSDAVGHMARLMQGRPFHVTLPDEVIILPMDGKLIAQVIVNLLDNAARHTRPGTPVSLRVSTDPDYVIFEVEDRGQGMDPSIRDTLFDRFVTVQQRVMDVKRGIGLGLAICKAVVDGHGGSISALDAPGGGSLLRFTLPRRVTS
jgi:two-component system, OmpR family, sensor histidine kinase KdpD